MTSVLYGLAALMLVVLLLLPATAWIVTRQIRMQTEPWDTDDPGFPRALHLILNSERVALKSAARLHPHDFDLQYAAVIIDTALDGRPDVSARLADLDVRFPHRAPLQASILRYGREIGAPIITAPEAAVSRMDVLSASSLPPCRRRVL